MDINSVIGENLKRLREQRNLSLGQLAEMTDVSKVMIFQIEKGNTSPSINTVWKLANGLKIPYSALLEQPEIPTKIKHKVELPVQIPEDRAGKLYNYYQVTPERDFELYEMEMLPGDHHMTAGHGERTEEYIYVIEGELTLSIHNNTFVLKDEDSIDFSASYRHTYVNSGDSLLKLMIINRYK